MCYLLSRLWFIFVAVPTFLLFISLLFFLYSQLLICIIHCIRFLLCSDGVIIGFGCDYVDFWILAFHKWTHLLLLLVGVKWIIDITIVLRHISGRLIQVIYGWTLAQQRVVDRLLEGRIQRLIIHIIIILLINNTINQTWFWFCQALISYQFPIIVRKDIANPIWFCDLSWFHLHSCPTLELMNKSTHITCFINLQFSFWDDFSYVKLFCLSQ